ncbi:MAG: signal peptidase II [Bacilli bacterium]|nr:signal peptidase II [Bacilli bacterium]
MKKISLIALCFLVIDQVIKLFITSILEVGEGIVIIKNFFTLTLLHNTGAAFSIFRSNTFLLIIVSFMALFLIYLFFIKNSKLNKLDIWLYGALIGGILGNLCDRIFRGYVVDYLDFRLFNFPVFNLADSVIVISVILIMIGLIRREKNGV